MESQVFLERSRSVRIRERTEDVVLLSLKRMEGARR